MAPSHARGLREVWPAIAGLVSVFLFEMLDNSILDVALPTPLPDEPVRGRRSTLWHKVL